MKINIPDMLIRKLWFSMSSFATLILTMSFMVDAAENKKDYAYENFPNTINYINSNSLKTIGSCVAFNGALWQFTPSYRDSVAAMLAIEWALIKHFKGDQGAQIILNNSRSSYGEIEILGMEAFAKKYGCANFNRDVADWIGGVNRN